MTTIRKTAHNGEIDVFRFIFSLIVLIFHWQYKYKAPFFTAGSIAVDFFFIVSGYLMGVKADKVSKTLDQQNNTIGNATWAFMMGKFKAIYYHYCVSIFLNFTLLVVILSRTSLTKIISKLLYSIQTFTLTFIALSGNVGLYVPNTWYISAMMLGMLVLFPILLINFDFSSKVLCPILFIFMWGYVLHSKMLNSNFEWGGFTTFGIIRSVALLALGTAYYQLSQYINQKQMFESKFGVLSGTLIKIGLYGVVLAYAYGFGGSNLRAAIVILLSIAILLSFSNVGLTIKDTKLTRYLGKLSLPIYLYHGFLEKAAKKVFGERQVTHLQFWLSCFLILLTCIIITIVAEYLQVQFKKIIAKTNI